jgi:hypothetical protein
MIIEKSATQSNMSLNIPSNISFNLFKVLYALIVGSSIIVFFTSGVTDITSITALRVTYIIILISLIFIIILISKSLTLQNMLLKFFPIFIPIIVFISYIIYLLFNYGDKISTNKVSDYYSTFMNLTNILLFIQITILLSEINIKSFENLNLSPKILSILKLFSVLTAVSGITLGIILKYYTTDG